METWPCTSQFLKLGPEILTRDLDQAHQNSTWRTRKKKKNGRHMAGQKFSKIMKLMKSQRIVCFFFSLPSTVLVSLVQIPCQNFRSELEKMSAAKRYWLVLSVLAGLACSMPEPIIIAEKNKYINAECTQYRL